MKKILFINVCVRKESRTKKLALQLLKGLDGEISEIEPNINGLKPLDESLLIKREELTADGNFSAPQLDAAREFAEADIIVIAAPYWDLTFPALLKIYLENITVCGVTFRYTEEGFPEGLCRAEKLYYVTTSGGSIVHNFGFEYVSTLANEFFGIKDTRFISAEGLDIIGADAEKILNEAIRNCTAS